MTTKTKKPATKKKTTPTAKRKATAPAPEHVLVLRTCDAQRRGHGGFQWPSSGMCEAPDWSPRVACGNGLHGLLWGTGDSSHLSTESDAVWMAVRVLASDIVDLDGKVKFPRGEVMVCGTREEATSYIVARSPQGFSCHYATATAGDRGTATAGYWGTATAGDRGTATAGYGGTATAGNYGTATAGDYGTATAGTAGTATAGDWGILNIRWYDGRRYRLGVFYTGENGIKPNTPYRCDSEGHITEAK